jgi:peptidoglycan/LPS O-acetylase OafA/YrhL
MSRYSEEKTRCVANCDGNDTISWSAPGRAPADRSVDRSGSQGKLSGVQTARGVAALTVVLYHATRALSLPQYLGYIPFGNSLGFGHAGVDFFFVLSGFIIMHAHTADIGRPERLYRYMWRRVTRIYPIYWVVTLIQAIRAFFPRILPSGWPRRTSSILCCCCPRQRSRSWASAGHSDPR